MVQVNIYYGIYVFILNATVLKHNKHYCEVSNKSILIQKKKFSPNAAWLHFQACEVYVLNKTMGCILKKLGLLSLV